MIIIVQLKISAVKNARCKVERMTFLISFFLQGKEI